MITLFSIFAFDLVIKTFSYFQVNTSGQFVGVAEMVGPVDFNKTVEYWQQDKWNGCFHVKWHIVKDVANSVLKHITLENNDNKPVTNSRDSQEVRIFLSCYGMLFYIDSFYLLFLAFCAAGKTGTGSSNAQDF